MVNAGLLAYKKNTHINNQNWWYEKILCFKKKYQCIKIITICSLVENDKRILFPLQFDDKITNYSE